MASLQEIDDELKKLAKALKRERFKGKAYGSVDTGRYVLLLEDADDLLDRRLLLTKPAVYEPAGLTGGPSLAQPR